MDVNLHRSIRSGKRGGNSPTTDLDELVTRLVQGNVFEYQEGRKYKHFSNFCRDPIGSLGMTQTFMWINDHKKKLASGTNAR